MSLMSTKTEIICRICLLGTQDKYFSLFEPYRDYSPAYHINLITNLQINDKDTLPDRICTTCFLELENAINFKIKCESSDAYLKKTLDDINAETNLSKLELPDCNDVIVKEEKDEDPDYEDYLDCANENEIECSLKPFMDEHVWSNVSDNDINVKVGVPAKCPVICHDCGGVFKSKCKLSVHWKKEHKIYLDCDLCKARYCSMKALRNHKLSNPERCKKLNAVTIDGFGKNRKFSCPECSYSCNSTNSILQHQLVHSGERKYNCDICNKSFLTPGPRSIHMENVHKMYKKVITCEVCGLKLFGQSKFYRHMRKHNPTYYECDICHKKMQSKCSLRNHLKRHAGVKNFSCEFCPKVVTTSAELSNHKRWKHLKIPFPKKYKECPICKYKTTGLIISHLEKHTGDNFACEVCGKFYDSNLHLWVHKMCHMPNTVERRTCPFCSKLCETAAATRKHMVVHLNKKDMKYNADQVVSRIQYVWSEVIQKPDITLNMGKRKKKELKETTDAPFPAKFLKVKNKAKNISKTRNNKRISVDVPKTRKIIKNIV